MISAWWLLLLLPLALLGGAGSGLVLIVKLLEMHGEWKRKDTYR